MTVFTATLAVGGLRGQACHRGRALRSWGAEPGVRPTRRDPSRYGKPQECDLRSPNFSNESAPFLKRTQIGREGVLAESHTRKTGPHGHRPCRRHRASEPEKGRLAVPLRTLHRSLWMDRGLRPACWSNPCAKETRSQRTAGLSALASDRRPRPARPEFIHEGTPSAPLTCHPSRRGGSVAWKP